MDFEDLTAALGDPEVGHVHQIGPDHERVLITFGGINTRPAHGVGILPFEFLRSAEGLPVGRVFVRDIDQAFYHRGVRGLGASISEVAEGIGRLVDGRHAVLVGASSGGYMAMLVGSIIGAERVIAASPQTFLGRIRRRLARDDRWAEAVAALHASPDREPAYLDVRRQLRGARPVHIDLFFGDKNRLDTLHARRLGPIPGVHLHPLPIAGHGSAQYLREHDRLASLLADALGVEAG